VLLQLFEGLSNVRALTVGPFGPITCENPIEHLTGIQACGISLSLLLSHATMFWCEDATILLIQERLRVLVNPSRPILAQIHTMRTSQQAGLQGHTFM